MFDFLAAHPWIVLLLVISGVQLAIGVGVGRHWGGSRAQGVNQAAVQGFLVEMNQVAHRVRDDVQAHTERVGNIHKALLHQRGQQGGVSEAALMEATEQLFAANQQLENELERVRAELAEKTTRLEAQTRAARTDPLTSLFNRRAFDEELERRLAQFRRQNIPLCIALLDVDHFKRVNDQFGHPAGDEVLRSIARTLEQATRDMDILARFGGEEFVAIFPGTTLEQAKTAVERIRRSVEERPVSFADQTIRITASLGLAQALADDEPALLVNRADTALYAAKQGGRNRAYHHDGNEPVPMVVGASVHSAGNDRPLRNAETAQLAERLNAFREALPKPGRASGSAPQPPKPRTTLRVCYLDETVDPPRTMPVQILACDELSPTGFVFSSEEIPQRQRLLVQFGQGTRLPTRVMQCTKQSRPGHKRFKVTCQFE